MPQQYKSNQHCYNLGHPITACLFINADAHDAAGLATQTDDPGLSTDDPAAQSVDAEDEARDALPESGEVMRSEAEEDQAAEAEPEVPAIPAEIPAQISLPRQADRAAVNAPTDAIGEHAACCH